jgi:MFS family permease
VTAPPDHIPTEKAQDGRYRLILLLLVMASVMAFGSLMTIVTIALGRMAEDLDSTRATMTWAITGLMLAMAVATPLAGKVGDVRGHRRIFLIGLAGCAVTTLACALAWDAASLIAFRALFGLSGAMVVPNALSLMMHAYGPARRATAVGWFQFAMTGAPTIGLVAGGPLIDIIGWRSLFVVFAVITAVAFVASIRILRSTPVRSVVAIDYAGGITLALGVLAALLAITRITTNLRDIGPGAALVDWLSWLLVIVAAVALIGFVRIERSAPAPMLQLDYFARRNFTLPMVSSALVQFAYMGGFVVAPALLTDQYAWSLGATALLLAPRPATFSATSPLGGYLPGRIGQKPPIVFGGVAMVVAMAAFTWASLLTSSLGIALILVGLVLSGASAGIGQPSVLAMVVDNVDPDDMGIANGMSQQVMFIGIVTGIQSMNVLAGDNASPTRFAVTFGTGLAVAAVGLVLALAIGSQDQAPAHSSAAGDDIKPVDRVRAPEAEAGVGPDYR